MTYKLIDLFSGAGGMTLGFTDKRFCGEFQSVLAVDNDWASTNTHEHNFKGSVVNGNIEVWLEQKPKIPTADVVIGGPPCQGFSLLNKNRSGDERRALWEPYLEVVEKSGSAVFVMENVAELFKSQELQRIKERAAELGFSTVEAVLNAANYGAPQQRKRTIVVGWRPEKTQPPVFPPLPTHSDPSRIVPGTKPWITVADAIGDLPPPKGIGVRNIRAPFDLHFGRTPTEKSLARYKAVPPGGNRFDLQANAPEITPDCWIRKKSGGTDLFGRLWWDRPSVTIRTEFFKPEKGRYLHPDQDRPITHREAARLMGFPDDFVFVGSKIEIARQIGNAVPPNLAGALAQMVKTMFNASAKSLVKKRPKHEEALYGEAISAP